MKDRCGIVLAAGEGKRLRPLVRELRGDDLPKQYVNFSGTRSLLERTYLRAERLIVPDRLFTVVGWDHLIYPEVWRQLAPRPRGSVVVQPENKETAPGLLLPLIRVFKIYPESTVVVFPSDHFVLQESLFTDHVEEACRLVEANPARLVLLGIAPDHPEPEYGYILSTEEEEDSLSVGARTVARFVEKPSAEAAGELIREGSLWNTMVSVVKAKTLLGWIRKIAPFLYDPFERVWEAIGTRAEMDAIEPLYKNLAPLNFSTGILAPLSLEDPSPLVVLPVRGVFWSDWGSKERVLSTLGRIDSEPAQGLREDPAILSAIF
jgi:mannose-1-phosphate guanylyltransferase